MTGKFIKSLVGGLFFSLFCLSSSWAIAQDDDQSSSSSGVLVSSPVHSQTSDQESAGNDGGGGDPLPSDQGSSNKPGHHPSSQNTSDIVVKGTDAVIFQMNANLKLTQDQITAVRPIIADNITKTRNLQQSLEDGNIDGKTMYSQRQQLINDEYQELGNVLTPDQLKLWINIQNDQ